MAESGKRAKSASQGTSARPLIAKAGLLVVLVAWAFVGASLVGFNRADPPSHLVYPPNDPVANWCGPFGAAIAYHMIKLAGFGSWVLVVLSGLGLLSAATGPGLKHPVVRFLGLVMLSAAAAGFQTLILPRSGPMPDLPGGLVGTVGVAELAARFGSLGTFLWLLLMALVGGVVAMDEWLSAAFGWTWRWARQRAMPAAVVAGKATGELAGGAALAMARGAGGATARAGGGLFAALSGMFGQRRPIAVRVNDLDDDAAMPRPKVLGRTRPARTEDDDGPNAPAVAEVEIESKPSAKGVPAPADEEEAGDHEPRLVVDEDEEGDEEEESAEVVASHEGEAEDTPGAPQVFDTDALRAKIARLPLALGQANKQVATDADLAALQHASTGTEGKEYRFPGMDMLENPEENFNAKLEEYVREQATVLEAALRQYRIDGSVERIESGPVITLYDVRLAPGTKVAAISAVSSDIARALKAINIRVVPNQVGRDTVGIEVPNAHKEKVRLKELMGKTDKFSGMKLPMFLGKDASGEPLIEDLTKMPHMLIAGTTGSGKSVCMNTIIMGFLYTKKPSELKMVLVDPKMVEMSQFKDIPHLMCPVVTDMGKACAILEWATTKMDERYALLAEAGCRDIGAYNDLPWEELTERLHLTTPEEEARVPRKLPYMVFIIDELADLMMTTKEVELHIIRIAQKARAVGIHLILATQRPQANVVTGLIKSNMPGRIAFKVASGMDSRIVLDQKGGELLLGHGDMLYLSPRSSKLSRAQGTLVDDKEIRSVVRFMRDVAAPSFERQLLVIRTTGADAVLSDEDKVLQSKNNSSASLSAAQEDPMFPRAVEIVLETKRGSVSLLQRRLAIGYTRASRLIDLMGIAGIISDHKGSVARDVLITEAEWAEMKRLAAEASGQGELFDTSKPLAEVGTAQAQGDTEEEVPAATGAAIPSAPVAAEQATDGAEEETVA